jgi:molybdate/tungstate transport system ATP-binding protein
MIQIKDLCIQFSEFSLKNINLNINKHEFFILLGPTGSGKTLLVESIAGILPITSGKIMINNHDMTFAPPEKRNVGIVYQDYALFPHMTVMENIQYGLTYHKQSADDMQRIHNLMTKTGILKLSNRKISTLSGGEKQRIALIRALAVNPSILLLDEPLSSLDPEFRDDIQKQLKILHKNTGTTFLMVTHNFAEALFLGDQGAVLNNGIIEQCGPVETLFKAPQTPFVARFMGFKNIFEATIDNKVAKTDNFELEINNPEVSGRKFICFRGEDIQIVPKYPNTIQCNTILGKIVAIIDRGPYCDLSVVVNESLFHVIITKSELINHNFGIEKIIYLFIPKQAIHTLSVDKTY